MQQASSLVETSKWEDFKVRLIDIFVWVLFTPLIWFFVYRNFGRIILLTVMLAGPIALIVTFSFMEYRDLRHRAM